MTNYGFLADVRPVDYIRIGVTGFLHPPRVTPVSPFSIFLN